MEPNENRIPRVGPQGGDRTETRACTQERRAIPIAKPTHPRTWRLRKPGAEKRAFRVYEEVSSTQRSPPSYNMEKMQPQYSFEFFCCCICRSRALDYERLFQALGRPPSLAYLIFFFFRAKNVLPKCFNRRWVNIRKSTRLNQSVRQRNKAKDYGT